MGGRGMDLGLKNKVAIVSAASQGLGFASARTLADEGASVVICSRKKRTIESAAKEMRRITRGTVIAVAGDVTKEADIEHVVDTAVREFGTVHIMVNNTGGPPIGEFNMLDEAAWSQGINLLLMSMIRFTRSVLPSMLKQSWGRVITITSVAAKQPVNDLAISSTLRPGLHALTKLLSNQYASSNVLFNTVVPGFILTKRQEEILEARALQEKSSITEQVHKLTVGVPLKRMGSPEELAAVVAFLASEQASYITGTSIAVDGGLLKGYT
jgi:3-oxoacyl-[acyl-carrier protein] reductase